MLALFLGIGTGGVFAWVARRAPARSVGSVTGIVAAAGGLGGYFPPLVMGATYNAADNNYTIGLLLLVATALIAFGYTALRLHAHEPVRAAPDKESATVSTTPHVGGPIEELLERSGRFFTPGEFSDDLRTVTRQGGREGDVFYRDRWSHDKVVRSTHGVNCTGSCSWKVYVKDGIITWETQETDYPSVGPDRPEYEPRGCPRGAAFSWYTLLADPGALSRMPAACWSRCTGKPRPGSGDPVLAWADIQADPERRRRYQRARGKGGLVRVSWAEATELIAAAHVHTIKTYGPDRVAGFSPIPAMSMVSFAAGSRFVELIGGVMTSFYDWYADLPVASPQVFGDQTDVPESGDWWDAAYLMMWGSNVPVTRTPDAHWMAEVRYRGTKVRQRQPRLRRQHEVRRRVDAVCGRDRRRAGDGDGSRHPLGMLRAQPGSVLRRLRAAVHRSAVPGQAGGTRRRAGARKEPHGRRSRSGRGERRVQTGAAGRGDRHRRGAAGLAGIPLRRRRCGQVEPGSRRPGTGFDRRGRPAGRPRWFICRASTPSTGTARPWRGGCRCGGSASTWCARCST